MPHRPYIVGNWKMHGTRSDLSVARAIDRGAQRYLKVEVALAPPYTMLHAVSSEAEWIGVGAQNCHAEQSGAFTGEISAPMVADAGGSFVIVGHSERREYNHECSATIRAKAGAALEAGLRVIVCCGESKGMRDSGDAVEFITAQLAGSLPETIEDAADRLAIGYEPIWAIGTGVTPSAAEISDMHSTIRDILVERYGEQVGRDIRIIYGGSVKADNAAELLAGDNVNGALVGGASLSAEDFLGIVSAAADLA